MSKKTLLKETTIRRFWKLSGITPVNEMAAKFARDEEDESLEEVAPALRDDDEPMEEGGGYKPGGDWESDPFRIDQEEDKPMEEMAPALRDEDEPMQEEEEGEMPEPAMDEPAEPEMDMDMGDDAAEGGDVEAEVSIPESDVDALRTARDVIDQILGASDEGAGEMDMGGDEEVADLPAPEPEAEEEEEPLMELDIDNDQLNEVLDRITSRVTKRILKEALAKKLTKN